MTLSPDAKRALSIASELQKETTRCIAWIANWKRANGTNDDIKGRYDHSFEAHSLRMIHDALHISMIMALMRMHDRDSRAASIPTLLGILDTPGIVGEFKRQSTAQREFVDSWLEEARHHYESLRANELLKKLRKLRNHVLAHAEFEKATLHQAKYGDEDHVLARTIPIVRRLVQITGSTDVDFVETRDTWQRFADAFWETAIRSPRWETLD